MNKDTALKILEGMSAHSHREFDFNVKSDEDEARAIVSEFVEAACSLPVEEAEELFEDPRFDVAHEKIGKRLIIALHDRFMHTASVNRIVHFTSFHRKAVNRFLDVFEVKAGAVGLGMKAKMPSWTKKVIK